MEGYLRETCLRRGSSKSLRIFKLFVLEIDAEKVGSHWRHCDYSKVCRCWLKIPWQPHHRHPRLSHFPVVCRCDLGQEESLMSRRHTFLVSESNNLAFDPEMAWYDLKQLSWHYAIVQHNWRYVSVVSGLKCVHLILITLFKFLAFLRFDQWFTLHNYLIFTRNSNLFCFSSLSNEPPNLTAFLQRRR